MEAMNIAQADFSILCVEDDPLSREYLSKMISIRFPDWKVQVAENGAAGLEAFRKFGMDIVLTDISMPVMDGIQMAREIRMLNPDACIISLSAHSRLDCRSDNPDELFIRHMMKPVNRKQLYEAIDYCIARLNVK